MLSSRFYEAMVSSFGKLSAYLILFVIEQSPRASHELATLTLPSASVPSRTLIKEFLCLLHD